MQPLLLLIAALILGAALTLYRACRAHSPYRRIRWLTLGMALTLSAVFSCAFLR